MNFSRTDAMDKIPLGNQNNMNNAHFSHQLIAGQPQMYQPNMAGVPNNMNGHFGGMYGNSGIAPGPGFDHLSMAPGVSAPNGQERQDHFLQESTSWSAGASADPLAQFPHQNSSFPYIPTYSNAPVISSSAMGMHCSSAQGTSTSMPMDMNYSSAQGMSSSMPMGMHCSSAQGTSTSMPMGMHCSSALGTSNNMHDPSDDTDIFQIAKQISNDNGNGSSFGYPQTSYNMDEPLLWNALTNFPASSGAGPSGGLDDLGFDFEDISKEQLLPITFTAPSFVSTAEQCIASSMSSLSSSMPSLSLSMPSLSSKYPTSQHSAAMFSPSYPAEPPAYSFAPTPTYPATPAPPAQTAHIDGIKNMFRMLDMPSTSSFLQADGAQPSTSMEQFLPSPDKTNIPCTVVNDSANTVNTADTLETKIEPEPEAEIEETPMKVSKKFQVDKSKLHEVSAENQSSDLAGLGLTVYNQEQLEEDIIGQLDTAIEAEELQKTKMMKQKGLNAVKEDIKSCLAELQKAEKVLDMLQGGKNTMNKDVKRRMISVRNQIDQKLKQLDKLRAKKKSLLKAQNGLDDSKSETTSQAESNAAAVQAMIGLDVDDKIRKGEMTPFGTVMDFDKKKPEKKEPLKVFLTKDSPFDKYLMDQDSRNKKVKASTVSKKSKEPEQKKGKSKKSSKDKNKKAVRDKNDGNFFDAKDKRQYRPSETDFSNHRQSKRSSFSRLSHNFSGDGELSDNECGDEDERYDEHLHNGNEDDDDYIPDELPDSDDKEWTDGDKDAKAKRPKRKKNADFMEDAPPTAKKRKSAPLDKLNCRDDGNFEAYRARIQAFNKANAKKKFDHIEKGEVDSDDDSDVELDGGFTVPGRIWSKLYPFQRTGVRWLWELHGQEAGGIVGDEMGLGKTIQIVGFLAGLAHSNLKDSASKYRGLGPSLIVVPATVMHQWVKEFHKWAPKFRVAILHNTGSYTSSEESLVQNIIKSNGILVTAYSSVVIYQEILLKYNWHYVILDEGHKIRNPDAQVTVAAKQFRTCHRLILSGSPIQNNLKELWSLFDFVFPGKLGTLPDFMAHFSVPIVQGGYSNASQVQVQTAYKCASVLRDTISPYLLRRMKSDVKENLQLPEKNEQVLFCRLTDAQRDVYQEYLDSRECQEILRGNFMVFPGLITLRKICNHPDLSTGGINNFDPDLNSMSEEEKAFGHPGRSGKMLVVQSLLKLWHKQGHRVLLFSQGTQMLNILESQVQAEGYSYMRMDGTTSIGARQTMVDKFNDTPDIFIFLLTTRVGGLGVNLCGANRVLLFDPDWNPSTDTQARERAWRIGQSRQVTIYRLLTTGTIEEKIYHRQIFKQFLTNRVLKDPKQRRFFKSNDLFELFTLSSDDPKHGTETGAIFAGTGSEVAVKPKKKEKKVSGKRNRFDEMKVSGDNRNLEIDCDEEEKKSKEVQERLEKMRELARKISQKMEKEKQELAKGKDGGAEGGAAEDIKEKIKLEEGEIEESEDTMPSTSQCASPLESCKSESSTKSKHRKHHHKDKKSSKRHHKRRKDVKFEGETISHLAKHSTYKTVEDENQSDKKDDDDVLQSLFKRSGVHSALQHDTIMMSSNPDFALVEGEAERVAKEAAAALKRSRARCYSARAGIPTWTGQSGKTVALNAPPKPRFGQKKNSLIVGSTKPKEEKVEPKAVKPKPEKPEKEKEPNLFDGTIAGNVKTNVTGTASLTVMSSSELMNRMKKRNHHTAPSTSTSLGQDPDDDQYAPQVTEETMEFITDIRHFIAFQSNVNGQATTQELLDEFSAKIPSKDSAQFKAMLKEICVFRKVDGVGMWKLRPEFW